MPIYHRDVAQYSGVYDELKLGLPTSSSFKMILTPEGRASDQWEKLAHTLIAERVLGIRAETYTSPWMARGLEFEEAAAAWYAYDQGVIPEMIGFITDDDRKMGCTPDRLIGEDGLLEIKIPAPGTQVGYIVTGLIAHTYKPQLQGQLFVSQRQWVDILGYQPPRSDGRTLPSVIIRVERDEDYIEKLAAEMAGFTRYVDRIMERLTNGDDITAEDRRELAKIRKPVRTLVGARPSSLVGLKAQLEASLAREDKARSAGTVEAHEPVPESDAAAEDGAATVSRETAGEASANLASPNTCKECGGPCDEAGYCRDPNCSAHWAYTSGSRESQTPGAEPGANSRRASGGERQTWTCGTAGCGMVFDSYSTFSKHRQRTGHKAEAKAVVGSIEREARAGPCAAGASGDAAPSPLSPRHPEFRHGKIGLQGTITREDARAYPDRLFVFGDNMARKGFGGQAKELRGEPNAVGIPTKWRPDMNEGAFFTNADWQRPEVQNAILEAFKRLEKHLEAGADVVYPAAGIGTGHAQLAQRAPTIAAHIGTRLAALAQVASIAEHTEQRPEALQAGRSSSGQDTGIAAGPQVGVNPETRVRVPPDSTSTEETFWDIAARSGDYKVEIPDNIATIGRDTMMNLVAGAPTVEALTAFYQGNLATIERMGRARVASRNELVKAMTRRKKELSGE